MVLHLGELEEVQIQWDLGLVQDKFLILLNCKGDGEMVLQEEIMVDGVLMEQVVLVVLVRMVEMVLLRVEQVVVELLDMQILATWKF